MFFLPVGFLIFVSFILFLPVLFLLGYFQIITLGFEKLGISPEITLILFLFILFGSMVNIPIGKQRIMYVERSRFFGLWKSPRIEAQGTAVNLGGAVIPIIMSLYFILSILRSGFSLEPLFWATFIMTVIAKLLSRVVPGVGIKIPVLVPPLVSAFLALMLAPQYAPACAFVAGTLGVLLGADILNLRKVQKQGGFASIGGAGVFDGIFLIGIASALLAGF